MSTPESWGYTPREFDARVRVYSQFKQVEHRLWCIDRADRLNGVIRRKDARFWTEADFMGGAVSDRPTKQTPEEELVAYLRKRAGIADRPVDDIRDSADYARAMTRDRILSSQMVASKNFDESQIPKWARMTDEEKKQRGIQ